MKFRNKETGELFNTKQAMDYWCCGCKGNECPINYLAKRYEMSGRECKEWIEKNSSIAAELMGYELVEEDMKKPLKDWTLEEVKYECEKHRRTCAGCPVKSFCEKRSHFPEVWCLSDPVLKWTEQEKQDAKTILRIFGKDNFTHVTKDQDGWPSIMDGDGKDPHTGWCSIGLEKDVFPTLKDGETVLLEDIIGEN